MAAEKAHICPDCGTKNTEAAKFCNNCGIPLKENKKTSGKGKKDSQTGFLRQTNSYVILGGSFVLALILVLIILSSNREALYSKLNPITEQHTHNHDGELQQRIQQLNMDILQKPNDYDLNVQLANSYFDIKDFSKASNHYRRALKVRDNDPSVLIDLGVSLFNLNQVDSAAVYMKKALNINPDHVQGLFNSGIVFYNLKQYDNAIDSWETLIEKHPGTREAQQAAGFIDEVRKQLNES
jgi:tetratricopeptide (TPR) repeat protein